MTGYHPTPPPGWQNWPHSSHPSASNGYGLSRSLDRIEAQTALIREDTKALRTELDTAKRWAIRGAMVLAWAVVSGLNLSKEQMVDLLKTLIKAMF